MKDTIKIVRMTSLKFSLIGLGLVFIIFLLLGGITGIFRFALAFWPNILTGIIGLLGAVWWVGGMAGQLIAKGKMNVILAAFLITFLSLTFGTLLLAIVGYFTEGIGSGDGVRDYILKPVFVALFYGGIPALILAALLGVRIKKRLQLLNEKK